MVEIQVCESLTFQQVGNSKLPERKQSIQDDGWSSSWLRIFCNIFVRDILFEHINSDYCT